MNPEQTRRTFLQLTAAAGVTLSLPAVAAGDSPVMDRRQIPGTDEEIPVIGLGTSDEFEAVPADGGAELKAVLTSLVEHGGTLIDTAPAYGDSEEVLGNFLSDLGYNQEIFLATKVGVRGKEEGLQSLERSQRLLKKKPLDLVMVHSLVDADTQLDNLRDGKTQDECNISALRLHAKAASNRWRKSSGSANSISSR